MKGRVQEKARGVTAGTARRGKKEKQDGEKEFLLILFVKIKIMQKKRRNGGIRSLLSISVVGFILQFLALRMSKESLKELNSFKRDNIL